MKIRLYFLAVLCLLIGIFTQAQDMRVATYNLRYDNKNDSINGNGWAERSPVISALIRFHDFDIFGTQEGYKPAR